MRCWAQLLAAAALLGLGMLLWSHLGEARPPAAPAAPAALTGEAALRQARLLLQAAEPEHQARAARARAPPAPEGSAAPARAERRPAEAPAESAAAAETQGRALPEGARSDSPAPPPDAEKCPRDGWPLAINWSSGGKPRWPVMAEHPWDSPWDSVAVATIVPAGARTRGATSGCVATREWRVSGDATVEELEHSAGREHYRARCWALTKQAPCQTCCGQKSCVAGNRRLVTLLYGSAGRANAAVAALMSGVDGFIDHNGLLYMESHPPKLSQIVGNIVDTWGLQWFGYFPPSVRNYSYRADRRLVIIPVKHHTVRASEGNFGHWLSAVFVPLLTAAWGAEGKVWPILLPGCGSHHKRGSQCRKSTALLAHWSYNHVITRLPENLGLPWVRDLCAPPADHAELTGRWRVHVACERCSPQEKLAAQMPRLRQWLQLRYQGFTFARSTAPTRSLVLLNRRRLGTRWIANTAELAAASAAAGLRAEVVDVAVPCSYGSRMAVLLNAADVVIGFNGADLGYAAVLQRRGSALVEIIDKVYAYQDGWELFQALFGSAIRVFRLILKHSAVTYHPDEEGALPEHREVAARARRWLSECVPEANRSFAPICWRFVASTIAIPVHQWKELLAVVSDVVAGKQPEPQPVPRPSPAPLPPATPAPPTAWRKPNPKRRKPASTYKVHFGPR